ncbi:hypothetical protein [methane-oxidizing endosymbiont of Gigantopelta aegis]|uniref:hypothetical protein n=1 Tax=methane-oxidizing endosymbiont of Gigantopelta aegis TaxID=2794938 RepID=UPI0018DCA4DD|nr:hypothetical protein [methane-oxidizing endosymbiont of Gigantopelta aegis]
MSLAHYGFQKLVLLNSAGYSRAELPLDQSVSIIAPNNTGKTSLINALQFLLIIDRRLMDFGAHSIDSSRKFYFPDNSAYILLEVLLPAGMVVIGCVGKGLSHDYEYFAYQGSLDVDDFRQQDNTLVTQPKLIEHLLARGKSARIYQSHDLRALLYGNRQKQRSEEPDLTVFPLMFTSQAGTYQRILTRTLRLDSLDSRQVKSYLLEIYKNDLLDRSINFKEEWDKSFADVNYDKSQFDAVSRNQALIAELEQKQQQRKRLRGKIIVLKPLIEKMLSQWEDYFNGQCAEMSKARTQLQEQQIEFKERQKQIYQVQADVRTEQKAQQQAEQRYQDLKLEFTYIKDLAQLQDEQQTLQAQRDQLVARLMQAKDQQDANVIRRQIDKCQKEQNSVQRQLETLDNNLFLQLQKSLSTESFDALSRLLAKPLLSSAVAADDTVQLLDEEQLQQAGRQLSQYINGDRLEMAGLVIDLSQLEANLHIKTADELQAELKELQQQEAGLRKTLETIEHLEQEQEKLAEFDRRLDECRQTIEKYKQFQQLQNSHDERQTRLTELENQLQQLQQEERQFDRQLDTINAELSRVEKAREMLKQQHQRIDKARQQRKDHTSLFTHLERRPHLPYMENAAFDIAQLADQIERYNQNCQELHDLDKVLADGLNQLHHEGINKFQIQDDPEQELQALFNYTTQLKQEQAAIERKARSAVVQVAAILRDLRDSLETLKRRMADFNKIINRRQLSDLKVFKIEPREEETLVNAIRTLISTSEQVDSGDSFDLFDHNTVLDDKALNKAKDLLIKQGEKLGSLKVEHLFRLVFVIGKQNQAAAEFDDLDSAASNGTVLMAKLITGLAMLNQMQDARKSIKTACYLDEAASLDQANQRNLIETANEFGFSLIFASPEPQITARYCVPIGTQNGKNYISRLNWQILEPIDETQA